LVAGLGTPGYPSALIDLSGTLAAAQLFGEPPPAAVGAAARGSLIAGGLALVGLGVEVLAYAFLAGGILERFANDREKFSALRRRGVIHRSQAPDDPRFAGRPAAGSDESRPYDATPNVSPTVHGGGGLWAALRR